MALFLGSGSTYLSRTYEPCYDRFDCEESDDDLRISSESIGSPDVATLDEVGYSFTPFGGIILHSKKEKVEAVYKKTKVPLGTPLPVLGDLECGICMTDIDDPEDFIKTSCGHQYCRQCMSYYLHLQSGDITNIQHTLSYLETTVDGRHHLRIQNTCGVVCPYPTCSKILEGHEFMNLCSAETWERFNQLALLTLMRKLEKTGEIVYCPQKCGGFIQNCICTSQACRDRTLMLAEKERLRLYRSWQLAETRGMALLRQWASASSARQCPKCKFLIEKNGGCDHMYCTACKTSYNWSSATGSSF